MTVKREVKEGVQLQGEDETITYKITATPWGSTPTSITANIYSFNLATEAYTDVTSANMTGTASANGDVITLPSIHSLTVGTRYRVEVQFTSAGNVFEPYFWIYGQR